MGGYTCIRPVASAAAKSEASKPASSSPDPKPSAASSGESKTSEAGKPDKKFTGASANDAFASVAHAGFEVGSEGRFGYSRKYADGWDRVFGKKDPVKPVAVKEPVKPSSAGGLLPDLLAKDTYLPADLKTHLAKLNDEQLVALR